MGSRGQAPDHAVGEAQVEPAEHGRHERGIRRQPEGGHGRQQHDGRQGREGHQGAALTDGVDVLEVAVLELTVGEWPGDPRPALEEGVGLPDEVVVDVLSQWVAET